MALAGDDQRVEDGGALAGVGVADEEPVLLAEGRRPDGVFDEVVVEPGLAVSLVRDERLPVLEQIGAGPAEERAREMARAEANRQAFQPVQRPGKVFLAEGDPRVADLRRVPLAFAQVECADEPQDQVRGLGRLRQRLDEVTSRVRPTADPGHVRAGPGKARIRLVAVRLEDTAIVREQRSEFAVPTGQPPVEDHIAAGATDHLGKTNPGACPVKGSGSVSEVAAGCWRVIGEN